MGAQQEAAVMGFLGKFDGGDWPDFDDLVASFSEDVEAWVVYPTTKPVRGRAALKEELQRQAKDSANPRVEVKAMASNDTGVVFAERVDHFDTLGKQIAVAINSVWEVGSDGL